MRREVSLLALILACLLAGALPRPSFAFNTQNPRWEAPQHYPPRQTHKPYRPLHLPPNELPPRQHREIAGVTIGAQERALIDLFALAVVTVAAQWLAASLRVPAGLWLLGFGVVIGPLSGMLDPDSLFGNLLVPLVSIGIALLLFLDGLSVGRMRFARERGTVLRLGIVGTIITWAIGTVAAVALFELDTPPALLLGLIVALIAAPGMWRGAGHDSRPGLRRLVADESAVARVVGGALVSLLLAGTLAGGFHGFGSSSWRAARGTLEVGLLFGGVGGSLLVLMSRRRWIPEALARSAPFVLAMAIYTLAEVVHPGCGLLAVITAAVLVGTQRGGAADELDGVRGRLDDVVGGILVLVLTARLAPDALVDVGLAGGLFCLVVLCARPLAVMLSMVGIRLQWRGRLLVMVLAPRGALALGLSTICGLRLEQAGNAPAESWAAIAVLVVAGSMVMSTSVLLVASPFQDVDPGAVEMSDRVGWPARLRGRG